MTALSFRQVLDRLNLSSDDDLLSLMARVPQWTDTGAIIDIYSPGMYGHEYRRDGVPLSLDGDSDRYISEEVGPLRLRMWVAREDFRCARRASAPYSSGEYGSVGWYMDESFGYQVAPDSPDTPPHRIRLFAGGAFRVWGVELMDDLVTFRLTPCTWQQPIVMPLYWQVPRPLPDVLADAVRIWPTGFHILKELLTSSTSDAKQPHNVNTMPAETSTAAPDIPYTKDDFDPGVEHAREDAVGRRALAVLVGHVIRQPVKTMGCLPARLETMRPGGEFQAVVNEWLEKRSDDERQRVEEIGGDAKGAFRIINQSAQPERIVIAEGLATTVSAWRLQSDAMAVMAGSAGNLEAVAVVMRERYPEAEIIIAADNDNDGKGKNTGKVYAEKAALAVGGTVALAPAEAGEKRDWNDVLVSEGHEAATMRFAGSMYRPTATEKTTSRKQRRATSDGESGVVIEDTDGGPMMRLRFRDTSLDICQKVDVVGYGSYEGKEYRVLRWMNNGRPATVAVNLGGFASSAALTTLMDGGLLVRDGRQLRSALANWIIGQKPATRWTLAASAGWTDDNRAYLLPDGHIIGDETPVLFMGKRDVTGGWTTSGTADTWRESVARLVDGNSLMMVCVAMPFAGPLLKLAGIQNFGLHLYAPSTTGKTTCATLAASVCGEPSALKMTWNGTANGIQGNAAARCDSFLWLDELGEGRQEDLAGTIYSLFNGSGRVRATKDGSNAPHDSWRLPVISTGEADTATFASQAHITLAPGQLVRLLNIPVEGNAPRH
ncbi:DUF927 domain-containing protein [Escherichia coli]|nr:DUF927 domain-containing protein [Escherichia coli]